MALRRGASLVVLTSLLVATQSPLPLEARPQKDKALCQKIQHAVRAGHTLEQIMADFQVDAQQVMTCTQKKGKRRKQKAPKAAVPKHAGSPAESHPSTATAGKLASRPAH